MNRDPDPTWNEFSPFAPPSTTIRTEGSVVRASNPPPRGSRFAIQHDLTDHDLKRFVECDFFYDPKPLLGMIPQWMIVVGMAALVGGVMSWVTWRKTTLGRAGGVEGAVLVTSAGGLGSAALVTIIGIGASAGNRTAARKCGFLEGRRITLADEGVTVDYPIPAGTSEAERSQRAGRGALVTTIYPILKSAGLIEAVHPWNTFRAVEFRRNYLLLWQQGRRRLVIPVAAFRSTTDAEGFAQAAAGWIASQ